MVEFEGLPFEQRSPATRVPQYVPIGAPTIPSRFRVVPSLEAPEPGLAGVVALRHADDEPSRAFDLVIALLSHPDVDERGIELRRARRDIRPGLWERFLAKRARTTTARPPSGYAAFVAQCIQIATSHSESFNEFLVALAHGVVRRSLVRGGVTTASTPVLAEDGQTQPQMTKVDALLRSFERRPNFFVEVRGDSMNAVGIRDGDLVAVRRDPDPRDGDIVIARIGNEITMKRYKRGRQCIELEPQSTNPEHETIRAEVGTDVETVGVVVGAIIGTPRGNR